MSLQTETIWYIRMGVKLILTGGHINFMAAFKGLNVILGLYKCNYSLTRGKELKLLPGGHKVPGG